jgi:hypothetical protein
MWIRNRLKLYIARGYGTPGYGSIGNEKEIINGFLDVADRCATVDDLWSATFDGISLYQYNRFLVQWGFGLHLVRFEYTSKRLPGLKIIESEEDQEEQDGEGHVNEDTGGIDIA